MSLSGYDAAVNACSVTKTLQRLKFNKVPSSAIVSGAPESLWLGTGMPGAGSLTAIGKANGRVCTNATAGAIPFTNPASGTTHLIGMNILGTSASPLGYAVLVDRICDVQLDANEATGTVTGMDATSRLRSTAGFGDGCQLWFENTTTLAGGLDYQIQINYTNERGTTNHTLSTSLSMGGVPTVNRNPFSQASPFSSILAAGDYGIRSIQSITRNGGTTTGNFNMCLVKPIAWTTFLPGQQSSERDYLMEIPMPERIYDSACLQLIVTIATTASIEGEIRIVSA